MRVAEPAVTLTDFALALECVVLLLLLILAAPDYNQLLFWFAVSFASIGIAATLGGVLHGFLPDRDSMAHLTVWRLTMATIGVTALAQWMLGMFLLLGEDIASTVGVFAALVLLVYLVPVLSRHPRFELALVFYLPGAILLLAAFVVVRIRSGNTAMTIGAAGMLLTLLAAWVQYRRIGLRPQWLDHNVLYHLIQAMALALIFLAARELVQAPVMDRI